MGSSTRRAVCFFLLIALLLASAGCYANRRRTPRARTGGGSGKPGHLNQEVELVAPNRFSITAAGGETFSIPMVANRVQRGSGEIRRAIILIPAVGRQIAGFHTKITQLAREQGAGDSTLVIGLQFLYPVDFQGNDLGSEVLYWDEYGWSMGDLSGDDPGLPRSIRISSFAITDSLVEQLIAEFPNLNTILVTGNSAGSKFTQRYAAGTREPELHPDIHFGFISSNGGTFLYLDGERPKPGTTDKWETPDPNECERYNEYPLGLEKLNEYMAERGAENIRQVYGTRQYVYLIGSLDTRPDYEYCAYQIQGKNRLIRNHAYWNYLQHYYGPQITQNQHFYEIEGATHNGPTYETETGRHFLFHWTPGVAGTDEP